MESDVSSCDRGAPRRPDLDDPASARVLVLSSLFPTAERPEAGVFIRERMFRVGRLLPIVVVAPQAWFPFQGLIRLFRRHFRPMAQSFELQSGFEVHRPWFFSLPGVFKQADGLLMAMSVFFTARRLVRRHNLTVIDGHFGYPDGYAACLLGRWLGLPVMVTLRGKEEVQMRAPVRNGLVKAIRTAHGIVCVSKELAQLAIEAGASEDRVSVIGNGVDLERFRPIPRATARRALNLPPDSKVLLSVGALSERKGFHRVISVLPALRAQFPDLHYLIVGGPAPGRDLSSQLRSQVRALGMEQHTHFLGSYPPDQLSVPYSAADVFVLSTRYEGWANVFLEAMACGLPVVTTRVGGNADVVRSPDVGMLTEFDQPAELLEGIRQALLKEWDRDRIRAYAASNGWDTRIPLVAGHLDRLARGLPFAAKGR